MFDSLVKIDNTLAWNGFIRPFHEAYVIKICDPKTRWSFWLRYTLLSPLNHTNPGVASLWAAAIDKNDIKTVAKENFELTKHDIVHTDHFISIGESYLSLAECVGSIDNGKNSIKWEFVFEDPVTSMRITPSGSLYHFFKPKTKFLAPRLTSFASGQIYVDHAKKDLKRLKVYQSHIFGTSYGHGWSWANCVNFREDSEAIFEAVSFAAHPEKKWQRPFHFFCLEFEGEKFYANSLFKALTNSSQHSHDTWHMEFSKRGHKFECHVHRNPKYTIGVIYDEPTGEKRYGYTCIKAAIEIKIYRLKRGTWQYYKTLSSESSATYETLSPHKVNKYEIDL